MNLVTVCGHNTTMLYHMLNHYHLHMDEIFVVLYAHHKKDPVIEQGLHILEKFNLKPHKIVYERPFDWERVTQHYNETKLLKPDDWWIVADDDEFHVYPKPIRELIEDCENHNYQLVEEIMRKSDGSEFKIKDLGKWDENNNFKEHERSQAAIMKRVSEERLPGYLKVNEYRLIADNTTKAFNPQENCEKRTIYAGSAVYDTTETADVGLSGDCFGGKSQLQNAHVNALKGKGCPTFINAETEVNADNSKKSLTLYMHYSLSK